MFQFRPLLFSQVEINDTFWDCRLSVNHERSLQKQYDMCERTGRLNALKLDWKVGDPNYPHIFWDSDVAKWLEAACYACRIRPDDKLRAQIDYVTKLFIGAQLPDGYINGYFAVIEPDRRWKNLRLNHELYSAGHIFEAAVAHFELTGTRDLLDVACRFADNIDSVFGLKEGQIPGYCGHQEIELALVRLYHATGVSRYLALCSYFVEQRGRSPLWFDIERAGIHPDTLILDAPPSYYQAHTPIREQSEAVGHAVRATYYYSAVVDLARENGDPSLFETAERLWENVISQKLYITGGIGSTWHGEAFTEGYDLPNERAYCETCASVALVFWAHRMLQHSGKATYAHVIERALYNGALSGMSLDGESFFYQNPLLSYGNHHRKSWFPCSCCPSNLSRLLTTLGSYIYSVSSDELRVHLYIGSRTSFALNNGVRGHIRQNGSMPWHGNIQINLELDESRHFKLSLRVPEWSTGVNVLVDGEIVSSEQCAGYIIIDRLWEIRSRVEVSIQMEALRIYSHGKLVGNAGQLALQRGPFIYCIEDADIEASTLQIQISPEAPITEQATDTLPEKGLVILECEGMVRIPPEGDSLYFSRNAAKWAPIRLRAIPYYAWGNRKQGAMRVWIPECSACR